MRSREVEQGMETTEFLVVGCGPAGGTAAREAARAGVATWSSERTRSSAPSGSARPACGRDSARRSICRVRSSTAIRRRSRSTRSSGRYDFTSGPAHTTTREELDGTIAALARARGRGDSHRARCFARYERDGATARSSSTPTPRAGDAQARCARATVFLAQGSTARHRRRRLAVRATTAGRDGLITCYQYRVYPRAARDRDAYETLEMHYYRCAALGRRRHRLDVPQARSSLDRSGHAGRSSPARSCAPNSTRFCRRVRARLFPGVAYTIREEGNLLYGGAPRPRISAGNVMVGGTAAGFVDATTGEGIHEAAMSGRFAARRSPTRAARRDPAPAQQYEQASKALFYGRLRHRHKLMTFLERRPARFDVLFEQLAGTPRFADLLQRERNDFTPGSGSISTRKRRFVSVARCCALDRVRRAAPAATRAGPASRSRS